MFSLTAVSFKSGKMDNITVPNGAGLFVGKKNHVCRTIPQWKRSKSVCFAQVLVLPYGLNQKIKVNSALASTSTAMAQMPSR